MSIYYKIDINEAIRKEGQRRRYSPRTVKTYQKCVEKFLYNAGKTADRISKADARKFLSELSDRGAAGSTLHVYHMAIRFFLEDILNKRMRLNLKYNRRPKKLPTVLSKEEIRKLFGTINNEKHRLMIELMYSAGLRVSELINLRIRDLELDKGYGFVRAGKGNKDRLFILSSKLKDKITNLINKECLESNGLLFVSNRNKKYHAKSLQLIVKNATKKAKIEKRVSCHTLRHSFATHLIENGYDVSQVQGLLGHKSPETTMVYVHMASPNMINIKSPIEAL